MPSIAVTAKHSTDSLRRFGNQTIAFQDERSRPRGRLLVCGGDHVHLVYITRMLPERAEAVIEAAAAAGALTVRRWHSADEPVQRDVLLDEAAGAAGLLTLLTDRIDAELLAAAPNLRVVANMAVGYDNIDVDACTRRGVLVTNTPGVLTETTADLVWALLMATARRVVEAHKFIEQDRWRTWSPLLLTGQDVYGATLGIIGAGRIGSAVARRAVGFGMRIVYHNRRPAPGLEAATGAMWTPLEELLTSADFVVTLVPLTAETHHLIGAEQLRLMKPSAVLVNAARGPVVDEQALYRALREGWIWAAGLDVWEQEPIRASHPLLSLPNVVALPHIGSASIATRTRMAVMAAENLVAAVRGATPANVVNPEVLG